MISKPWIFGSRIFGSNNLRQTIFGSKATTVAVAFLAAAIVIPTAAKAVSLTTITRDYGSDAGKIDPFGDDVLNADSVVVAETSSVRFSDTFDFTSLSFSSITSFELTLEFSGAGPNGEAWVPVISGTTAPNDFFGGALFDTSSPQTFLIDPSIDAGPVDAFSTSVTAKTLELSFVDIPSALNTFELVSATLEIFGEPAGGNTNPVPVPMSGLLILSGLGLLGFAARRRS